MPELRVALGDRAYDVLVDWAALTGRLAPVAENLLPPGPALLLSDRTVASLYGAAAHAGLEEAGLTVVEHVVEPGEGSKSLEAASGLWSRMIEAGLDRRSSLVALGGGVVCDLGGFAAATYMRGIPCLMIPTSLLAQVDASVGGKVALNLPAAKNLVGVFAQPAAVLADPSVLRTLSRRDFAAGLAESVKMGAALDGEFFGWIETNTGPLLARERDVLVQLVHRSVEIKAAVVARDERETAGHRSLLNLGHTVGHALEALYGFTGLGHGEAVSIGLAVEARVARTVTGFPEKDRARLVALLSRLGLPVTVPAGTDADSLMATMARDKKNLGGVLLLALPDRLGRAALRPVPAPLLREALD